MTLPDVNTNTVQIHYAAHAPEGHAELAQPRPTSKIAQAQRVKDKLALWEKYKAYSAGIRPMLPLNEVHPGSCIPSGEVEVTSCSESGVSYHGQPADSTHTRPDQRRHQGQSPRGYGLGNGEPTA
jgi:hypothetical protein